MNKTQPKQLIRDPGHFLSLGFGSGLIPVAPGTFGTLAAIPVYLLLSRLSAPLYMLATLASVLLGVYLCRRTGRALGVHDHSAIVWDEFAGFFITMILVPVSVQNVVIGFCLFRIFDIVKPWPASVIDTRLRGGLGVMLDDVVAGIYAAALLHVYLWLSA